jgi:acyl dehydratase
MTARLLGKGQYGLADLKVGDRIALGSRKVGLAEIDAFASLTGDRFAIHMQDTAAQALGFARRVAHGLLILSLVDGMKNQAPAQFKAVASLGWDWRFAAPILGDEVISASLEVTGLRPTSRANRSIATLSLEVHVGSELRQQGINQLMILP